MGPTQKKTGQHQSSDGALAAKQIVFYASKHELMSQANLRSIGRSSNFHKLFVNVCKEEPTNLRVLLEKAREACTEAEEEDKQTRMKRKKEKDVHIAAHKRRRPSRKDDFESTNRDDSVLDEGDSNIETLDESAQEDRTAPQANSEDPNDEFDDEEEQKFTEDIEKATTPSDHAPAAEERMTQEVALVREQPLQTDQPHNHNQLAQDKMIDENGQEDETISQANPEDPNDEVDGEEEQEFTDDLEKETILTEVMSPAECRKIREVALTHGEPFKIDQDYCFNYLAKRFSRDGVVDVGAAMDHILRTCVSKLNPEFIQSLIIDFLEDLLTSASIFNRPLVSADSSPETILEAL